MNLNIFYWLNKLLYISAFKKKKTCANRAAKLQYKEKKTSNL